MTRMVTCRILLNGSHRSCDVNRISLVELFSENEDRFEGSPLRPQSLLVFVTRRQSPGH